MSFEEKMQKQKEKIERRGLDPMGVSIIATLLIAIGGGVGLTLCEHNRFKENREREKVFNELRVKVLQRAEMYDGKPGLGFEEQVEMANKLGYENIIREGEIVGLEVEGDKGPNHQDYFIWLRVGKEQRYKVNEKKLEDYLGNGGKGR